MKEISALLLVPRCKYYVEKKLRENLKNITKQKIGVNMLKFRIQNFETGIYLMNELILRLYLIYIDNYAIF